MLAFALVLALHACPQRIRVVAPAAKSTSAQVTLTECGRRVLGPWRAWVGYAGLSAHHREGDGTTPIGTFAIGPVVYGLDPDPGLHLRYHRLRCGDWWDEDPASPTYNSFRSSPAAQPRRSAAAARRSGGRPSPTASSRSWSTTHPRSPGRGSAIFLHDDRDHPTNGCISLPRSELVPLLQELRPGATISISVAA